MSHSVADEARAFDLRIRERIAAGHVPDLRQAKDCDWFYNNPWRRPYLARQVFGEYAAFALRWLTGTRVLEVGSGPGHLALELARHGFHVTGLDVSEASVEAARRIAEENPFRERFGSLRYTVGDFMDFSEESESGSGEPSSFDSVCFFGSLHHFDDPDRVVAKAKDVLAPCGRIVVVEPARDEMTSADAAIIYVMRALLASRDGWYERRPLPDAPGAIENGVAATLAEYRDARDPGEAEQSPHDNACSTESMVAALRTHFSELASEPGFAFYHRMGGGVRAEDEAGAERIANFLYAFDRYAVETGLMRPGMLYWCGEVKA